MKLKEFNAENTLTVRTDKPTVHINTKTGLFNFSRSACVLLNIKHGDRVTFHQDEEEPTDWYVEKVLTETGFPLRANNNTSKGLLFSNTSMARAIVHSVKEVTSGKIAIVAEPTKVEKRKLYALLTASLNKYQD